MCRSNPASSVVIALARNATWLDDAQVQSIFHRLRHDHDPINRPGESREQMVDRVYARADNQIARDPALRPQRRAGLRSRLEGSRSLTGSLGDDTLLAMVRLQAGVQAAQLATEGRLTEIAGRRGMSVREARAEFIQLRSEAPSGRQPRATAPELRDLGIIPSDPATRHALAEMARRPPFTPPARLVDQWLTVTGGDDVTHVGVGTRSTRVEFRHADGSITATRNVDSGDLDILAEAAGTGRLPNTVAARIQRESQPLDQDRVEATAYAPRCDECGQFTGDRFHECQARAARVAAVEPVTVICGAAELSIAPAIAVRHAVASQDGPVVLDPVVYCTRDAVVTGSVTARSGEDVVTAADRLSRQQIDIDDAEPGLLVCSACPDAAGACPHVAQARAHIRDHLASAGRLPGQRTERAARADLLHNSIAVSPRPDPEPPAPAPAAALSFVDDPEAFRTVIRQGGSERQVPFMTEDALHGYAAGTQFGVELEFNGDDPAVRAGVAQRLRESGLISSASYSGYHTATRSGYNEQGLYSLENDCSVRGGGELVTSIESDSPQSWERLRRACEAISGGGATTHFAGSHTNIGSPGYRPQDAWRLARLFRAHEDDLLRCGRTPNSQRLNSYNAPLRDPGPQWDGEYDWGRSGQRESVVNFTNAFRPRGRIEFRFPDASHDPGVIQAQVKLAAAMTNYSRTDLPIPDGHQQVGTAQQAGWTNQLMASTAQQWAQRTERIRGLIDTLFDRQDDRVQIAMLWAHGRYRRG